LSKASLALYAELQDEFGPPMDFARPGSLDPFYDEKDLQSRKDRVEGLRACGVDCRLLDRKEVQEVEPAVSDVVVGATYCPVDGHITPPSVTWAWAAAARRAGAEIRIGVPVTGILKSGSRVIGVRTANEEIHAGWVVNVAGDGVLGARAAPVHGHREVAILVLLAAGLLEPGPEGLRPARASGEGTHA